MSEDELPVWNNEGQLLCPECGGFYLHQGNVEVFNREKEDAEEGLHLKTRGVSVDIDRSMKGNPSGRRQGLLIEFICESCNTGPVAGEDLPPFMSLEIYQHKGVTYTSWRLTR